MLFYVIGNAIEIVVSLKIIKAQGNFLKCVHFHF